MGTGEAKKSEGSGRWLLIIIGTGLLAQTALNLIRPVTTYKLLSLGADSLVVGLVTAAYALLPLFCAMWLGRASSRVKNIRLLMLLGTVLLSVAAAGIALSPSLWAVAACSALLGMGHLIFTIGGQSSIARFFPDDQLDKCFGWFTASYSAGQFLGPLIAGGILGTATEVPQAQRVADIGLALWLAAACALLAVPLLAPNFQPPPLGNALTPSDRKQAGLLGILRIRSMPSHMLASMTLLAAIDILTAFLPLVAERHLVAPATVGLLLAVRGVASVLSRLILPWISGRIKRQTLLLISLFGAAATLGLAPVLIEHALAASLALFVGGFCLGLGQPVTMTMVSTSVPSQDRGAALAVRLMGNRLGQVVLPLAAGATTVGAGPAGAIWFCCGLLALSGVEKAIRRT